MRAVGFMLVLVLLFADSTLGQRPTTLRVPLSYPSIQAAINAPTPGDTVLVDHGLYYENIRLNKNIVLAHAGNYYKAGLGFNGVCNRWLDSGEMGLMGVYTTPLSYPFPLEDMNDFLGTNEYAWEGKFCVGAINVSGEDMDPGYFDYGEFPNQTDIVSATGVIVLPQGG